LRMKSPLTTQGAADVNLTSYPESDQLRVLTAMLPPEYSHAHFERGMAAKESHGWVYEGVALIRCGWRRPACSKSSDEAECDSDAPSSGVRWMEHRERVL
jgi:hypothetical protein